MEIESTSLGGYLRFWLLAKLRRWRPRGHRYALEQAAIEQWLSLVVAAARISADVAVEVADCARLIKGYGDTWARGTANYDIIQSRVIRPILAGGIPAQAGRRRDRERTHRRAGRSGWRRVGEMPRRDRGPHRCGASRGGVSTVTLSV